jgi:hypothetical protein
MRNRNYGHHERKKLNVCPFNLKEELLDPREGGGQAIINERL